MIRVIAILTLASVAYTTEYTISVNNGAPFGDWGELDSCPGNQRAVGFKIKVEPNQGEDGDDTAVNAIGLKCSGGSWIYSSQGM